MKSLPDEKALIVNTRAFAIVIALWWLSSLIVVRALLEVSTAAPFLEWIQQAIPAARKYARDSGFAQATAAFYCYFLITTPVVAIHYFRFTTMTRAVGRGAMLIMWLIVPAVVFFMSIGVDIGPVSHRGFHRMFNLMLTSSWFGSSLIFLLFCHCLLGAIVCIAKDRERRIALAQRM